MGDVAPEGDGTPWKINMEPENYGLEDDFPDFNWVIFRFHVNLPGCTSGMHNATADEYFFQVFHGAKQTLNDFEQYVRNVFKHNMYALYVRMFSNAVKILYLHTYGKI